MEAVYTWREALLVASMLNVLHRQSDKVTMATFAQMVNTLAPILTNDDGSFCQTIYHPLHLYREHGGNWMLACEADSVKLTNGDGSSAASASLDVSASYHDEKHEVIVAVVNRHPDQAITAEVHFAGAEGLELYEAIELQCPSWESVNGFDIPDQVMTVTKPDARYDANRGYAFPPHSITLLKHRHTIAD